MNDADKLGAPLFLWSGNEAMQEDVQKSTLDNDVLSISITHDQPLVRLLVYDLKSVGVLEIEFVAPNPEQIATTTMHFSKVS